MAPSSTEQMQAQASMTAVGERMPACHRSACGRSRRRADGALWFGTDAGLARRSPDGVCCRVWTAVDGLPSGDIHALAAGTHAPDGSKAPGVWVGTTKGLAYIDGERVTIDSPVAGADIQALTVTPDGNLVASVAGRGVWQRGQAGDWQILGKGALVGEGPSGVVGGTGRTHLGRDEQRPGLLPESCLAAASAAG